MAILACRSWHYLSKYFGIKWEKQDKIETKSKFRTRLMKRISLDEKLVAKIDWNIDFYFWKTWTWLSITSGLLVYCYIVMTLSNKTQYQISGHKELKVISRFRDKLCQNLFATRRHPKKFWFKNESVFLNDKFLVQKSCATQFNFLMNQK